jgi:hypothetical protein
MLVVAAVVLPAVVVPMAALPTVVVGVLESISLLI